MKEENLNLNDLESADPKLGDLKVNELNDLHMEGLKEEIIKRFKQKTLYKGFSEVLKSIYDRKPIHEIYILGKLDFWYQNALTKGIDKTKLNEKVKIHHLPEKYRRFIYDTLKNISLDETPRKKPRRFYYTRVFAI